MPNERLDAILNSLKAELEKNESLDDEQVARVQATIEEIQGKLNEPPEASGLVGRLRELEQQFEESHPTLTNTIGQLADMLAQMGI